ncbi:MAG TPA: class II fructose-bisphosphate aldolase [Thermodesulfobacteriota bacterium]|nr:class II fructose-bisphosphate aldolase [Thermodesulfobacteriota bacterium]
MFQSLNDLKAAMHGAVEIKDSTVIVSDVKKLEGDLIDSLVYNAVFNANEDVRNACRWLIRMAGQALGITPASIQPFYEAMGREEVKGFTVPAINIRGLTYDTGRAVFRAAKKNRTGALIFEIAKSEIQYTEQPPAEYMTVVMAAAIKEGFRGPLFVQGDHFQLKAKNFEKDPQKELDSLKSLISEAIKAGFYNIDIDASTLVDLDKPGLKEQQENNYEVTAELTSFIREHEPKGVTVSVGGEIGEVGGKNSTLEDLRIFMDNYLEALKKKDGSKKGISKISIQTGTTHGGIPLPDGTIAKVKLDFKALEDISEEARKKYGLSGAVQHGASTLPDEAFDRFPTTTTAEVHLATGFQNIIYDSPHFPHELKETVYAWLRENTASERKPGQTDEQFYYSTRKKGFGPLKKAMWDLPEKTRMALGKELEDKFDFLFKKLNVVDTEDLVKKFVSAPLVNPPVPAGLV